VSRGLHFDAVVIGTGTAGLVAGARLAQGGARVCVLAKGIGSTHLAPGTIDVLGYRPKQVRSPAKGIRRLAAERTDHPYALLGGDVVAESLSWFTRTVTDGPFEGYRYVGGGLERNLLLPTALGALKPSALVPSTFAAWDSPSLNRVCIAGLSGFRDFHPGLCAGNLALAGISARAVTVDPPVDRPDVSAVGIARLFDDPRWRAGFCARLGSLLGAEEHVGLPAVLGLRDPAGVLSDLERRLGRRVFEIPGLPPSVPGMRLYEILRAALRAARGRHVLGAEVVSCERDGDRLVSVGAAAGGGGRVSRYSADWFVLASGGFASGGIELDSRWVTRERVLGLPLAGVPADGAPRFAGGYFDEQPMARVGVAVDGELRAQGIGNVLVAGAALPGAVPWREGSGEGIALASGYRVAQVVAAAAGASGGASAGSKAEALA